MKNTKGWQHNSHLVESWCENIKLPNAKSDHQKTKGDWEKVKLEWAAANEKQKLVCGVGVWVVGWVKGVALKCVQD